MWIVPKTFPVIVILFSCSIVWTEQQKTFKKEWKFQDDAEFTFSREIAAPDNSFLYTACSEANLPKEINCDVIIEIPINPWDDTKSRKYSCELQLKSNSDENQKLEVSSMISIDRLSKYKAIIVWWEREPNSQFEVHNVQVVILNLLDCVTKQLSFPVDTTAHFLITNVVIYSDSFDMIISNKDLCGRSVVCRITHDVDGEKIGSPSPFPTNLGYAYTHPVKTNSWAKGFYISGSDMNSWKFRALHVSPAGILTNLMTVGVGDPRNVYWSVSNTYELYGICLMGVNKIYCSQYDDEFTTRINSTIQITEGIDWMSIYNLKVDGMLIFTGHCKNQKCRSFSIRRIDNNGVQHKPKHVQGLQLRCSDVPDQISVDIAENETDFCIYFACMQVQGSKENRLKNNVKFSVKCVPKAELKL